MRSILCVCVCVSDRKIFFLNSTYRQEHLLGFEFHVQDENRRCVVLCVCVEKKMRKRVCQIIVEVYSILRL